MSVGNETTNEALQRALIDDDDDESNDMDTTQNDIVPSDALDEAQRKAEELDIDVDSNIILPCERMSERAKYIPLRLTYEERKVLRLVNASITVSDYTTNIDSGEFKSKSKRDHARLQNICGFLSGLICANEYDKGQSVLADRNFSEHETPIQQNLEIARRYKIMNPEKLRSEYGKLVLLMQDALSSDLKPLLGIDIYQPVLTVYDRLESCGGLEILKNSLVERATIEILPDKQKHRSTIQNEIKGKEKAIEGLCHKYATSRLSSDTIRQCLYSICDNNSFLNSNLLPIQQCISLLKKYFHPRNIDPAYSLAIEEGAQGARLTHSHELQYNYVLQSLTLWASVVQDMFRLWYLAEQDMLSPEQPYELQQTGQGLQRVQQSPRVYKAMHEILYHTQRQLGGWVGSSVIHLGDRNVPNTLVFIDKYTQVSRILGPLVKTLDVLETDCSENDGLRRYMGAYGGIEKAKKDILHDFFTHAFDGSGGDNFFDAGSCIDGRLTSAWHWCSQLASKPYAPLFRLTGFLSFDGEFDK
eukprot:gene6154-12464_t